MAKDGQISHVPAARVVRFLGNRAYCDHSPPFALARGRADVALTASPRLSALFNTVITSCFYVCFYCSKRPLCRSVAKFLEVLVAGMCIYLLLS